MKINLYFGKNNNFKTRTLENILNNLQNKGNSVISNIENTELPPLSEERITILKNNDSFYLDLLTDTDPYERIVGENTKRLVRMPVCKGNIIIIDSPENMLTESQLFTFFHGIIELSATIDELYIATKSDVVFAVFGHPPYDTHYYICENPTAPKEVQAGYFLDCDDDDYWDMINL
jgi:hypothetical protein